MVIAVFWLLALVASFAALLFHVNYVLAKFANGFPVQTPAFACK